jgi:hypothetical protein
MYGVYNVSFKYQFEEILNCDSKDYLIRRRRRRRRRKRRRRRRISIVISPERPIKKVQGLR